MNRIIVVFLALMMMGSSVSYAKQRWHGKEMDPAKHEKYIGEKMEKMTKTLDLNANQSAQVETILREKMDKKKALMDSKHAEMRAITDEFKSKMSGVLNADQQQEFDEMMAKHDKKRHCKKKKRFLFF